MRLVFAFWSVVTLLSAQSYDIVLQNGRVMDPESGLDGVRSVGIRAGKIAAISGTPLKGNTEVDAKGLVIAPGFIDLHAHGQKPENYRFQARDGVTTALELEIGVSPVAPWYAEREGHALINYGASSGHVGSYMRVLRDTGQFLPKDNAMSRPATAEEKQQILSLVKEGLDQGGVGVGLGIMYVPFSAREEIYQVFRTAADRKVPVFVHMRYNGTKDPGAIAAAQEVLADAAATGAPLHIVHITSTGLRDVPTLLQMIGGARARGIDVTTEAYSYTAGMTRLDSAVFNEGWQEAMGVSYDSIQWVLTGERLTKESFDRYRKQGGYVVIHSIPEEVVRYALASPLVMVASDSLLEEGKGHPRAAGNFSRVLARYVREQKALTLMDALRKMSLQPAQRLEGVVPGMKNKGRIRLGADADIAVFDAARVQDKATFANPAQYSEGIPYVLVGGQFVVKNNELQNVLPGKAVRGAHK